MAPHGHGGGYHYIGHHRRVHHFSHRQNSPKESRKIGTSTKSIFVGGATTILSKNQFGGYWGRRRRFKLCGTKTLLKDFVCAKSPLSLIVFFVSLLISMIIGIVLLSIVNPSCPSDCRQETCVVTNANYAFGTDDTVTYDCSCDNYCADKDLSSVSYIEMALGIAFVVYFAFGLCFAIRCAMKYKTNHQSPKVIETELNSLTCKNESVVIADAPESIDIESIIPTVEDNLDSNDCSVLAIQPESPFIFDYKCSEV